MDSVTLHKDMAPFLVQYHINAVKLYISPVGLALTLAVEKAHDGHRDVFEHMARSIRMISSFAVTMWPVHIVAEASGEVAKVLACIVKDTKLWSQGWLLHVVPPGESQNWAKTLLIPPNFAGGHVNRLQRLEITDFWCWKSRGSLPRKVLLNADMTMVVGAIGAGKSALIEAMRAAVDHGEGAVIFTDNESVSVPNEGFKPALADVEQEANAILHIIAPNLVNLNQTVATARLSTGQKCLVDFAAAVATARLKRHSVALPVLFFDGIVEALDQRSLLLVVTVLRQLAYHPDPQQQWQVIVTARNDEIASQLAERLRPPTGNSLRCIDILPSSDNGGPNYKAYCLGPSSEDSSMKPPAERLTDYIERMWSPPLTTIK